MQILVLDIETTGLDICSDMIVEIGGVLVDINTAEIRDLFHYLIKEPSLTKKQQNAWIFRNSNLKFEEVWRDGIPFDEIRPELQGYFNQYCVASFNESFDLGFLRHRQFRFPSEGPDIMLVATNLLAIPHDYYGLKYPKVSECMYFFNLKGKDLHRALEDARIEAQILLELRKKGRYILQGEPPLKELL